MNETLPDELHRLLPSLQGMECWYVSCGGAASSTFQLALGEKVPRPVMLQNAAHSDEFRRFEGEVALFVWCAWRLDARDAPLTSWDDTEQAVEAGLTRLVGSRIDSMEVLPPAWDLNVRFSNALCLRVFCDHVPGEPSFDGNWDLRTRDRIVAMGPGTKCRIDSRTSAKL
jgi:hypothetical protein